MKFINCLLLHSGMTLLLFMISLSLTDLPGGSIGMVPFLIMFMLFIHISIGAIFSLILREKLNNKASKLIGVTIYAVLYEFVGWLVLKRVSIVEAFSKGSLQEVYVCISFSSIVAFIVVSILIQYKKEKLIGIE